MSTQRRLIWVGDAGVSSGFARITHGVVDVLAKTWDVHVLAINFTGDPHEYPYKMYPAWAGGDAFGVNRVKDMVEALGPSAIVILNDAWNLPAYLVGAGKVPVLASLAVDGKNCRGAEFLSGAARCVFWTQFGLREARLGGYSGAAEVIPLGVDVDIYHPIDGLEVRRQSRITDMFKQRGLPEDAFVVGVVNRNQDRKRFDLTIRYFANWIRSRRIADAVLYIHSAPTGDAAYDVKQLGEYYGISSRLVEPMLRNRNGSSEQSMARTYALFDCFLLTSTHEGWNLPTMEAMACGVPCIVPDWAGVGDWTRGVAMAIDCTSIATTARGINAIGGVMDEGQTLLALDQLYRDREARAELRAKGLALTSRPEYRWPAIGEAYARAIDTMLAGDAWAPTELTGVTA